MVLVQQLRCSPCLESESTKALNLNELQLGVFSNFKAHLSLKAIGDSSEHQEFPEWLSGKYFELWGS